MSGKPRILAIRGGAIGDFILTLPALRLIREDFAHCGLEILGYPHIASLALRCGPDAGRTYADALHSIEYGPMAGFFARNGTLDSGLCEFFSGYQQVVSWLFDPDGIFETNIRRAGVKNYVCAYAKITDEQHAAEQLARGLESMAMFLDGPPQARLVPSPEIQAEADGWLKAAGIAPGFTAIHPGSGSPKKNWPLHYWQTHAPADALVIGGEADAAQITAFPRHRTARDLPLPLLAGILARSGRYIGHDTGISHLAAAVGARCRLLFGPTAPSVWAPVGENISVIQAPGGDLASLSPELVFADWS
jgi:heptosyltransferase-2